MAKDVVEFSLQIEKISFTFKGAREKGEAIGQSLNRLVGSVNDLQRQGLSDSNVIDVEPAQTPPVALPAPAPAKPRRRKKSSSGTPAPGAETDSSENGNGSAPRRNTGSSPNQLLLTLRKNGVFRSSIGMAAVLAEIHKLGYGGMKHSDISSPLSQLTKSGVLAREKGEDGKWLYKDGPTPVPEK